MNEAYARLLTESADDRRDVFRTAAQRLGTTEQNVEKDFWVCWTLDVLYNGRAGCGAQRPAKPVLDTTTSYGVVSMYHRDPEDER